MTFSVPDVLAFEREWLFRRLRLPGAYESEARARFGLGPTAYALALSQVIDSPTALEVDATTTRLLLKRRAAGLKQSRKRKSKENR